MKIKTIFTSFTLLVYLLFTGCTKDIEEYNKPAIYWYSKMITSASTHNLEKADDYYSSLQGEHIGSPLLPEATMILAIAHMDYEEYLLAEYFFDEYIKRYANPNEKEFAEFMKIKAKYLSLPNPRRDQVLVNQTIKIGEQFKYNYPYSDYFSLVDSMLTNLYLADASLNKTISDLYTRLDKPKSSQYYKELNVQKWIQWDEVDRATAPWYREWFEGDGSASWYGFIIPDTQSVVSRNSIVDDNTTLNTK